MFNRLFRKKAIAPQANGPRIPPGERVYAVGDIHGRLDLLRRLVADILADDRQREPADTQIILLGDLVDRGPDSAGVIDYVRDLMASGPCACAVLAGNHEEVMLTAIEEAIEGNCAFLLSRRRARDADELRHVARCAGGNGVG